MNLTEKFSNKEVHFRFNGVNLSFLLSQRLFSSFAVDSGTKLLLKTIAKEIDFSRIKTVADIGCGVGIIGLSLKKKYPGIDIFLQDRDALAIEFSRENARKNNIKEATFSGNLALEDLSAESQDLIISNLPAKAGEPVLVDFIEQSLSFLTKNGKCIVVVVDPLKEIISNAIRKAKGEIVFKEETREYSVFHYSPSPDISTIKSAAEPASLRKCYIRKSSKFKINKLEYSLKTVYNLPGFDTLPYKVEITAQILKNRTLSGKILIWNPEQGHLPVICQLLNSKTLKETVLASRDILQLIISKNNLMEISDPGRENSISIKHICCLEKLYSNSDNQESPSPEIKQDNIYDSIILSVDNSDNQVLNNILPISGKGTTLVITGKSAHISEALKVHKGWKQLNSKKYRGYRTVILQRNS